MTAAWLDLPAGTGFGLDNLPYGVFSTSGTGRRSGVAIGDVVLDLAAATGDPVHATGSLNAFLARGPAAWQELRARLTDWFTDTSHRDDVEPHLVPRAEVTMHLPVEVADYVDFYSSQHHAENLGRMFRPDSAPLTPNWKHLPIGYHGRAGTVRGLRHPGGPSERPAQGPHRRAPTFGPSQRLDIEAEVGFVVGTPSELGTPVPLATFPDHVFGVCLVNDWSARDLQAWEYVPLGPFLGKSFAHLGLAVGRPARRAGGGSRQPTAAGSAAAALPRRRRRPLGPGHRARGAAQRSADQLPAVRRMYWTAAQQLAHMTVNGASLRTGDLYASGTVSGPAKDQRGSLIELSWDGTEPLELPDGTTRTFLENGDVVTLTATAPGTGGGRTPSVRSPAGSSRRRRREHLLPARRHPDRHSTRCPSRRTPMTTTTNHADVREPVGRRRRP